MTQFEIECIESRIDDPRDHYDKFLIEPLEPGQGITLGNALRRVLLSDLEGTAIVSVRIAGVNHEFSTISGIREDVLEILLNLKEITFKSTTNEPLIGRLRIQGPTIVTAESFDLPSELTLVDPKHTLPRFVEITFWKWNFGFKKGVAIV
jgi:DNA-directed RNA polymerase subunit alpha